MLDINLQKYIKELLRELIQLESYDDRIKEIRSTLYENLKDHKECIFELDNGNKIQLKIISEASVIIDEDYLKSEIEKETIRHNKKLEELQDQLCLVSTTNTNTTKVLKKAHIALKTL